MKIHVTLNNRSRLNVAEWIVLNIDYKVLNEAHHILDVVWVNPKTLEVYVDVETIIKFNYHMLVEADNRNLFNAYSEENTRIWTEKWNNVQKQSIVPIHYILHGKGLLFQHGNGYLSSYKKPSETLNMFFHWLEEQGRNPDEIYEELYQKCGICLLSPSDWEIMEKYDDVEWDDEEYDGDLEVIDRQSEDAQMLQFLMNQPEYDIVIEQIERDSYHMSVRNAMDLIVTIYDHNPSVNHNEHISE